MTHDPLMETSGTAARPERTKPSEADLREVFQHVADLAKLTLSEVAEASVTVVQGKNAHTPAYTGELALALDQAQYQLGHGPCMLAASAVSAQSVREMTTDSRWPAWTAGAIRAGARSSLSIPLPINDMVSAALNLYATTPNAFDDDDIAVAQSLARYASLAGAGLENVTMTLSQHMTAATNGDAVIEQAKGITMSDRQCTAEEAFAILTSTAQDTNRSVQDVAKDVVNRTGQTSGEQECPL
jgi:transcriptional regulator with GAF, ATPase, and Fis domain